MPARRSQPTLPGRGPEEVGARATSDGARRTGASPVNSTAHDHRREAGRRWDSQPSACVPMTDKRFSLSWLSLPGMAV